jgi:hypothetical protein
MAEAKAVAASSALSKHDGRKPKRERQEEAAWGDAAAEPRVADEKPSKRSKPGLPKPKSYAVLAEASGESAERKQLHGLCSPEEQAKWLAGALRTVYERVDGMTAPRKEVDAERSGQIEECCSHEGLVVVATWPADDLVAQLQKRRPSKVVSGSASKWVEGVASTIERDCLATVSSGWSLPSVANPPDSAIPVMVASAAMSLRTAGEGKVLPSLDGVLPPVWQPFKSRGLAVLYVCNGANRCTDVLRALEPLRCRCSKLWARHMKVGEQLNDVVRGTSPPASHGTKHNQRFKGNTKPVIGVGTPGRLVELAQRGAFGKAACEALGGSGVREFGREPELLVLDLRGDAKKFSVLTPGTVGVSDSTAQLVLALCGAGRATKLLLV